MSGKALHIKACFRFVCFGVMVLLALSGCASSPKAEVEQPVPKAAGPDEPAAVRDPAPGLVPEALVQNKNTPPDPSGDVRQQPDPSGPSSVEMGKKVEKSGFSGKGVFPPAQDLLAVQPQKPGEKGALPFPPMFPPPPGLNLAGQKEKEGDFPAHPPPVAKDAPKKDAPKKDLPDSEKAVSGDGEKVQLELAFDNADLFEVLDVTLFELFEANYMVDPSIKAKVTFHVNGSFTRIEFINFLNNLLQLNNLAVVQGPGNIYMVVRRANSPGSGNPPIVTKDGDNPAGDVIRMYKLRYMAAATALNTLRPMMSKGAISVQEPLSNTLILTDTLENIARAATIISILDVPYFKDISWRLYPLKGADVDDVAKDVNAIFKTGGLYHRPGVNVGSYTVMPIKSLNALLVVTRWPELLDLVESWVTAFDQEAQMETGTSVYVYFAENATAEDLADVLKQLYGGKPSTAKKQTTSLVPQKAADKTKAKEPDKRTTTISGDLSGDIEIVADGVNNALVIKATKKDYRIIKEVLDKLDIVPLQVLINVMVAEIKLSDLTQFGVEWFLEGSNNGYTGHAVSESATMGTRAIGSTLGATSSGFSFALYDASDFMRSLVTALDEDSKVNILSSPSILAVDNKEALIEVVEEIPVVTGKYTDATGAKSDTIEYKKTGVILKVTPQINSSGLVKLELSQEVSKLGEKLTADNYSILNRTATTSLVIEDGQTIVIGGMMDSYEADSDAGIPYLKDIPVLGALFKRQSKEIRKTELIILITPNFINNRTQADRITKEFSKKVNSLKGLIDKKGL